jgi:hypothetical protein
MLLLGGLGAQDPAGSVWGCTLPQGQWSQIATLPWVVASPTGNGAVATAVYDSLRDQLLVMPAGTTLDLEALSLGGTPQWSHVWSGPDAASGFAGLAIDTQRDAATFLGVWDAAAAAHRIVRVPLANPASWTSDLTQGAQPSIPARGAAVYDAMRDVFDVLVGSGGLGFDDSTQLFALNAGGTPAWTGVTLPAFPLRPGYANDVPFMLSLDAAESRLLMVGATGATLALPIGGGAAQWLTSSMATPALRFGAAGAFDPIARRVYVDGGAKDASFQMARSVLPLFTSATVDSDAPWSPSLPAPGLAAAWLATPAPAPAAVSDSLPRARFGEANAVDPVGNAVLWYGGQATDGTGDVLADLWTQSLSPLSPWQRIIVPGPTPGIRRNASFLYDAARDRFLLVGGDNLVNRYADVWELRLRPAPAWRQLGTTGTVASYSTLVADAARGDAWCVFYGAYLLRHVTLGDDVIGFEEVTSTGISLPQACQPVFAGFDPVQRRMFWFPDQYHSGGYSIPFNQLWTTSLAASSGDWLLQNVSGPWPTPRGWNSFAYDATTSRILISGGEQDNGVYFADHWALQYPVELPTAALTSLVDATSDAAGVTLRWSVGAPTGTPCTVERSADAVGWSVVGSGQWIAASEIRFTDAPLASGTRAAYRLRVGTTGAETVSALVWLDAAAGNLALSIRPATNPCRGIPSLRLTLASGAPARMRLQDVSGRVVGEATLGAGTQQWTSASSVRPGLYFAEVVQGRERRVTRVVVTP